MITFAKDSYQKGALRCPCVKRQGHPCDYKAASNTSTLEQYISALRAFVLSFNALAGAVTLFVVYTGICAVKQIIECYTYKVPESELQNKS